MGSGPTGIMLASIRNTEAYLRWQGAQWAIALNLSASVALMYQMFSKPETPEFFTLAFACGCVAGLNFEWYTVLRRDGKLLGFWNAKLTEHEVANGIEGGAIVFTSSLYQQLANSRNSLQRTLERVTVGFIFGWAVVTIALFTWALATLKGAT